MNYTSIPRLARYQAVPLKSQIATIHQRPVHLYCKTTTTIHSHPTLPARKMSSVSDIQVSSTPPICTLSSLDHLVLTVRSIPDTIKFYTEILGMAHQSFTSPKDPSVTRHALLFGPSKINLHQAGKEFEPKAKSALPGTADLCFLAEQDVGEILNRLKERDVTVLEDGQVVSRTGARSMLRSVYVRDPDGNLIEISNPSK